MNHIAVVTFAAAVLASATPAAAVRVVDYQRNDFVAGQLTINTASAPRGHLAIGFTLGSRARLTGASVVLGNVLDTATPDVSRINWTLYRSDDTITTGPGTAIASGFDTSLSKAFEWATVFGAIRLENYRFGFDLPSMVLGAGRYYLSMQSVSTQFLGAFGATGPGDLTLPNETGAPEAWRTTNNGASWIRSRTQVMAIDGTFDVPEPATWVIMALGFGLAGAMLRRRRVATAIA